MKEKDEEKQVQKTINVLQDYKDVFGTPKGKRVLYDILGYSNFMEPTTRDSGGNIHLMDRNEGRREVGLYILHKVQLDIPKLVKFLGENSVKDDGDFI